MRRSKTPIKEIEKEIAALTRAKQIALRLGDLAGVELLGFACDRLEWALGLLKGRKTNAAKN